MRKNENELTIPRNYLVAELEFEHNIDPKPLNLTAMLSV